MYWWNEKLEKSRAICLKANRKHKRFKGNIFLKLEWNKAKKPFTKAIKQSQSSGWKDLIAEVEKDTWGLAYKILSRNWYLHKKP